MVTKSMHKVKLSMHCPVKMSVNGPIIPSENASLSISKNVYTLQRARYSGRKQFFFLQFLPRVTRTWAKTHLYPPWKPHSGTFKDEIERQLDPACTWINVLGRRLNILLLNPLDYVCPQSLALCINTQPSEHDWVDLCMELNNHQQTCTFR